MTQVMADRLMQLNDDLGDLPAGLTIHLDKDWRILLAGVSFGLLFLAAARGLLNQQAKESAVFFRLGEKVNYYERLASVVEIRSGAILQPSPADIGIVQLVIDRLLERDPVLSVDNAEKPGANGRASDRDKPETDGPITEVMGLIKDLR